ncbi:hypothetical protein QQS21_010084 [Conoideocrella luteorostrata]|uniref:Thioredoxin-like protein n=1 Tax=Conoideocrella luteorostrata TaxID=1105319 RepID=A0AAJ0CGR0_9HYPO|nr:hypothetical protein QQS21_010084 [Conoideocrella luteorostrata]
MTTYATDPALYIFTSLTAGSSHIVTATSRLETILRANRVPFKAVDIATDPKARMLWGRRAGKDDGGRLRKLPGLVQEGEVLGDLVEIEDWNEYGELKQHVKIFYDEHTIPNIHNKPAEPPKPKRPVAKSAAGAAAAAAASSKSTTTPKPPPAPPLPAAKSSTDSSTLKAGEKPPEAGQQTTLPMRSVADEAAQKANELRLKSLREKVHGKKADGESKPPSLSQTTTKPDELKEQDKSKEQKEDKSPGLQSPTSSAWKNKSGEDAFRETVQSPTSGKWRPGSTAGGVTYKGAAVLAAERKEIDKVENEYKIEEEPELEKEVEEKDAVDKKKLAVEEEEEDDKDDDEESEEDDEDEEQDETEKLEKKAETDKKGVNTAEPTKEVESKDTNKTKEEEITPDKSSPK